MYCSKQHVTCMRIRDNSLCSRVLLNTKNEFCRNCLPKKKLTFFNLSKMKGACAK